MSEPFVADGGAPEYQEAVCRWSPSSGKASWRSLVEEEARAAGDDPENIRCWEPADVDLDAEFDLQFGRQGEFTAWSADRVYFSDEDALGDVTVRSVARHPGKRQ